MAEICHHQFKKKRARQFDTKFIPGKIAKAIKEELESAKTQEEIKLVFDNNRSYKLQPSDIDAIIESITPEIVEDFLSRRETDVIAGFGGEALTDVLKRAGRENMNLVTNNMRTSMYLRENFYKKGVLPITADTKKEVARQLQIGIAQNEDYRKLSKRVDTTFKSISRSRAGTIAVTETGRAANFAIVEGYKQSGVVSSIRWVTTFLNSRETHIELNGAEVLIGQSFSAQSPTHGTVSTEYPLQFGIPEEDINCHCRTVAAKFLDDPIVEQEAPIVESPTVEKPIIEPPPIPEALSELEKQGIAGNYQKVSDSVDIKVDPGVMVDYANDAKQVAQDVKETFDLIDSVHDIGMLRTIPVNVKKIETRAYGTYQPTKHLNNSPFAAESNISIDPVRTARPSSAFGQEVAGHTKMTTAHETGHWIDNKLLANPKGRGNRYDVKYSQKMGSAQAEKAMLKTQKAMADSDNYKYLEQMKLKLERQLDDLYDEAHLTGWAEKEQLVQDSIKHIDYLLDPEEVWARAYAQYIAEKSGDKRMLAELKFNQTKAYGRTQSQWATEDFESIKDSIDEMFRERGWIGGKKLQASGDLLEDFEMYKPTGGPGAGF